jgi:hypothetical protein
MLDGDLVAWATGPRGNSVGCYEAWSRPLCVEGASAQQDADCLGCGRATVETLVRGDRAGPLLAIAYSGSGAARPPRADTDG